MSAALAITHLIDDALIQPYIGHATRQSGGLILVGGTGSSAKPWVPGGPALQRRRATKVPRRTLRIVPVEFLSDDQLAAYGRFAGPPDRGELERFSSLMTPTGR